ncbi:MAG: GIY-YIG nuclease family protein [Patescibacteria group bacterium UBA2103]
MSYTLYILKCKDNTLYTGYTTDIERRVFEHNEGKLGAKYTKARRPVEVIYTESFKEKGEAMRREIEIKKLTRKEKLSLINKE